MRVFLILVCTCLPVQLLACERPICRIEQPLPFTQRITFDGQPSGFGPGRQISGILTQPHAQFGERFVGQSLGVTGDFDAVTGRASPPLTLRAGVDGQNLSVLRLFDGNILSGDGHVGVPRTEATGEGAMAIAFDRPQNALRLTLRGGEGGSANIQFLTRDGVVLDTHMVGPLGENSVTFVQTSGADIAGVVITNTDPQGLGLQIVEFELAAPIG